MRPNGAYAHARPARRLRPAGGPRPWLAASLLALALSLAGGPAAAGGQPAWWAQVQAEAGREGYGNLSTAQVKEMIDRGAPMLLLDVRADYEYSRGHLPGARNLEFHLGDRLNLSPGKAEALSRMVGPDKDRLLVIYCRSFK